MLIFGASFYMVLMCLEIRDVASPAMFYFLGDNVRRINTTDITEAYGFNMSKLVVYFNGLHYVDTIKQTRE